MDGVLVREERAIAGADRFLQALAAAGLAFLVLMNNSIYTRRDLSARLRLAGPDADRARAGLRRPRRDAHNLPWVTWRS
jgi:ribonucleotide monophosphatase NagD (HAD superfamily)